MSDGIADGVDEGAGGAAPMWSAPNDHGPVRWLQAGLADFATMRPIALRYGAGVFVLSWAIIVALFYVGMSSMILPAIAASMLGGPILATGVYALAMQKDDGEVPTFARAWARLQSSLVQLSLLGAVLMIVLLSWLRVATIIFALHFGLVPMGGFVSTTVDMLGSPLGLSMLLVGTVVGGLFAAFTFAIGVFSVPMVVARDVDAFTAMGRSFSCVAHNAPVMARWGAIVAILTAGALVTGLLGLIVVFPVLGFATWRAYQEVFDRPLPEPPSP